MNIEEQIKEIIQRLTSEAYSCGQENHGVWLSDDMNKAVKQLTNLLTQQRDEAVEYEAMKRFGIFLQNDCGIEPMEDDNGDIVEFETLARELISLERGHDLSPPQREKGEE